MAENQNARMLQMTEQFEKMVQEYFRVQCRYEAAIHQVQTKLEILDSEFHIRHSRNPIHHMQSRMKTLPSIMEKLNRRQQPVNLQSAQDNLTDIAGIRVICSYINDIYTIADLLTGQDDVRVIKRRDYIRNPKPNGYRSLHLVVEVPVYLEEGRVTAPVEVQIRTIAMDFWATLEHELRYKNLTQVPEDINRELLQVASEIAVMDQKMQSICSRVEALDACGQPGAE